MFARRPFALVLAGCLACVACRAAWGEDRDPARLLPQSTVVYLTVADPGAALEEVLRPELMARLEGIEELAKVFESPGYRRFREAVSRVEERLGRKWPQAVRELVGGGLTLAHDPRSGANFLFIQAAGPELLTRLNDTAIELIEEEAARRGAESPVKSAEHNGVRGWSFGKDEAHAIIGNLLVISNKSEAVKEVIDAERGGSGGGLAASRDFQAARKSAEPGALAWGMINLQALRLLPKVSQALSAKSDNPVGELLLGGVLDVAARSPFVTLGVYRSAGRVQLRMRLPDETGQPGEARKWHFPQHGDGAPPPLRPKGVVATLTAYRDLSGMWLAREQLFNDQVNSGFTKAETNLGLYFQGKDFGAEVLSQLAPRWQIVVARQEFPAAEPVPAVRLPAFALVLELKDEALAQSLQLTYQNIVGIINITGLQTGKPQLIISGEEVAGVTISKVKRVIPEGAEKENAPIEYNFSPACAQVGKHFVIGSSGGLVRELAVELKKGSPAAAAGSDTTVLTLHGDQVLALLKDNLDRFTTQHMLEQGKTREKAERDLGRLLHLGSLLAELTLRLSTGGQALTLELDVGLRAP